MNWFAKTAAVAWILLLTGAITPPLIPAQSPRLVGEWVGEWRAPTGSDTGKFYLTIATVDDAKGAFTGTSLLVAGAMNVEHKVQGKVDSGSITYSVAGGARVYTFRIVDERTLEGEGVSSTVPPATLRVRLSKSK